MKKFKAILFDLDGTLLDTLQDLADSTNYALKKLGFPQNPVDAYNYFVGDGTKMLAKRALPIQNQDDDTINKCLEITRSHYKKSWRSNTKPYPGITDMLQKLHENKIKIAILSNKPDDLTKLMVSELLSQFAFAIVQGAVENVPLKPDPTFAIEIARKMNIPTNKFLYLGDTGTDMQTAVAAGMYPLGVLWGFRNAKELKTYGAKTLIENPNQIFHLIQQ